MTVQSLHTMTHHLREHLDNHETHFLTLEQSIEVFRTHLSSGDQYGVAVEIAGLCACPPPQKVSVNADETVKRLRNLADADRLNMIDYIDALLLDAFYAPSPGNPPFS